MRYRKLDKYGDMTFGHQQNNFYINSPEAVAQAVVTRLKLWLGEWFIDMTEGTPYQQAILGKGKQLTIEPALRERVLETTGVKSIIDFDLQWNTEHRSVKVNILIDTDYGQTKVMEVL